jgi:hypothetical protein
VTQRKLCVRALFWCHVCLLQGTDFSINIDAIRVQLQRLAMPGQKIEIVTGLHELQVCALCPVSGFRALAVWPAYSPACLGPILFIFLKCDRHCHTHEKCHILCQSQGWGIVAVLLFVLTLQTWTVRARA